MNRRKKKYTFIDSNNIRRCTYDIKREFSFNDYNNVYYQTGYETIDGIFETNGIPEEYRKVIMEVDDTHPEKGAEEIFTKMGFIIRRIGVTENGLYIRGNSEATDLTNWMDFYENFEPEDYSQVLLFINKLNDVGLLGNYMNSILTFFRTNLMVKDIESSIEKNDKGHQFVKEKH